MAKHKYHYHVRQNDPESMPENPPDACWTKREAQAIAASMARNYRDDGHHLFYVESLGEGNYDIQDEYGNIDRVIRTEICHDAKCIAWSEAHPYG